MYIRKTQKIQKTFTTHLQSTLKNQIIILILEDQKEHWIGSAKLNTNLMYKYYYF